MIKVFSEDDHRLLVTIHEDINFETARSLEQQLKSLELQKEVTSITVDVTDVRFIDSTGVSLMIKWLFPLSKECEVSISGASEPVKNILRISKIDQVVSVN